MGIGYGLLAPGLMVKESMVPSSYAASKDQESIIIPYNVSLSFEGMGRMWLLILKEFKYGFINFKHFTLIQKT